MTAKKIKVFKNSNLTLIKFLWRKYDRRDK